MQRSGWNVVGSGSGMRGAGGHVGVGVGVVVWVRSVEVELELAMSGCVVGADATFVGGSSVMMSIGVSWVSW